MADRDLEIIEAMETYGGSFAAALALAARRADQENLAKIKATWPELWARYAEMAKPAQ